MGLWVPLSLFKIDFLLTARLRFLVFTRRGVSDIFKYEVRQRQGAAELEGTMNLYSVSFVISTQTAENFRTKAILRLPML